MKGLATLLPEPAILEPSGWAICHGGHIWLPPVCPPAVYLEGITAADPAPDPTAPRPVLRAAEQLVAGRPGRWGGGHGSARGSAAGAAAGMAGGETPASAASG